MHEFALVVDGRVTEVVSALAAVLDDGREVPGISIPPTEGTVIPLYAKSLDWRPAPHGCAVGWVEAEGGALAPPPQGASIDLRAYTRRMSWQKRITGVPVNGVHVATDAESLMLITGMVSAAQLDPERTFAFDTAAGPIPLTAAEAIAFGLQVLDFVQATFDRRAEVLAAIDAGTITATDTIDAAFADL